MRPQRQRRSQRIEGQGHPLAILAGSWSPLADCLGALVVAPGELQDARTGLFLE